MSMLASAESRGPRLADVLASCLASIQGLDNPLRLPPARSAVALLVDGLGAANLRAASGHARTLAGALGKRSSLPGVFPATTAVGIASFTTGADAGSHGLVGYRVLDRAHDRVVNQLSGWDARMVPTEWQPLPTVFENAVGAGVSAYAVGPRRYARSGLTEALLRGAEYVPAESVDERFAAAAGLIADGRALVYVYVPELDIAAHARGWLSDRWIAELETLDAAFARFLPAVPSDCGVVVTADHGVLDVPATSHVLFDAEPALLRGVRHIGGDPRCLYLYLEPDADPDAVAAAWRSIEGARADVFTKHEAIADGRFGDVTPAAAERIGDVIVAARKLVAYYDSREPNPASRAMIGQHGSLTDEESRVPLLRFGAYGR